CPSSLSEIARQGLSASWCRRWSSGGGVGTAGSRRSFTDRPSAGVQVLLNRPPRSDDALFPIFFNRPVFGALAAQGRIGRAVPFVTIVRKNLIARGRGQWNGDLQSSRVCLRIVDRRLVHQQLRLDSGEPLGDLCVNAGVIRLPVEIRGLHHERLSFPVAATIAH